jgi:hypothetical protein
VRQVKIGVVGCGMISSIYLKNCTQTFDILDVVAVAGPVPELARRGRRNSTSRAPAPRYRHRRHGLRHSIRPAAPCQWRAGAARDRHHARHLRILAHRVPRSDHNAGRTTDSTAAWPQVQPTRRVAPLSARSRREIHQPAEDGCDLDERRAYLSLSNCT